MNLFFYNVHFNMLVMHSLKQTKKVIIKLLRASVANVAKIMPFYHIKNLLYYFTTSFYNISFIRCFIIQLYTLKQYLLHIKIIYYLIPIIINNSHTINGITTSHQYPLLQQHLYCKPTTTITHQYQINPNCSKKKKKKTPQPERGRVKGRQKGEGRG